VTVPGLPWCWGIRPEDLTLDYPCEGLLGGPVRSLYRAVDVTAWPELTYRWLCQMRVAPYSYDLLDNLGRRSPTTLTPGADELAVGTVMMVFHVTSFEPGVHITGVTTPKAARIFGRLAATYLVVPRRGGCSRIIVRLDVADASGLGCLRSRALAWGDLVMMRKQLLTLKSLAERDQAAVERVAPPMSASTPAGVEA
jgi:hypothetical protein